MTQMHSLNSFTFICTQFVRNEVSEKKNEFCISVVHYQKLSFVKIECKNYFRKLLIKYPKLVGTPY